MQHTNNPDACILMVDDEILNLRLLELVLECAGFTNVHATTDARKALALLTDVQPDLVLTDLHMPVLDGFALIAEIRRQEVSGRHIPVLVLSGDTTHDAKQHALVVGASAFLAKPVDPDDVLERLDNHLAHWFGAAGRVDDASAGN